MSTCQRKDIIWVYRLHMNNIPLMGKGIIHPRGYELAKFLENDPIIHVKCLDKMGLICDIIISDKPLKFIETENYRPISLKNSIAWVFSMDPKCELTIRTLLFSGKEIENYQFSMINNINYNKKFANTFIKNHPETAPTFLNIGLIKNQLGFITSTRHYDYFEAIYVQKEIEKRL